MNLPTEDEIRAEPPGKRLRSWIAVLIFGYRWYLDDTTGKAILFRVPPTGNPEYTLLPAAVWRENGVFHFMQPVPDCAGCVDDQRLKDYLLTNDGVDDVTVLGTHVAVRVVLNRAAEPPYRIRHTEPVVSGHYAAAERVAWCKAALLFAFHRYQETGLVPNPAAH